MYFIVIVNTHIYTLVLYSYISFTMFEHLLIYDIGNVAGMIIIILHVALLSSLFLGIVY